MKNIIATALCGGLLGVLFCLTTDGGQIVFATDYLTTTPVIFAGAFGLVAYIENKTNKNN